MAQAQRKFDGEMNYYVPVMQAGGDLGQALNGRIEFGVLAAADADGILSGQSIADADTVYEFAATYSVGAMGPWGRNVVIVADGAATSAVTVIGRDYLGQKVKETFALNGTTPVVGKKAFKYIDGVDFAATAARSIDVGWGALFGLPYVGVRALAVYVDNVYEAPASFVAPVFTDPQTATTGDPRGAVSFTTAPNGSRKYEVDLEFTNFVNGSGNGGLHGIRHFFA